MGENSKFKDNVITHRAKNLIEYTTLHSQQPILTRFEKVVRTFGFPNFKRRNVPRRWTKNTYPRGGDVVEAVCVQTVLPLGTVDCGRGVSEGGDGTLFVLERRIQNDF